VGELWAAIPLAIPHQVLEDRMRKGMSCFSRTVPRTPVFVNDVVDQAWSTSHSVSRLLGISAEQVDVISDYFEDDREGFTAHLAQWLQGRNVNAAIVIREARREAETELRLDQGAGRRASGMPSSVPSSLKQWGDESRPLNTATACSSGCYCAER
jgi:hypothetical protein